MQKLHFLECLEFLIFIANAIFKKEKVKCICINTTKVNNDNNDIFNRLLHKTC